MADLWPIFALSDRNWRSKICSCKLAMVQSLHILEILFLVKCNSCKTVQLWKRDFFSNS